MLDGNSEMSVHCAVKDKYMLFDLKRHLIRSRVVEDLF